MPGQRSSMRLALAVGATADRGAVSNRIARGGGLGRQLQRQCLYASTTAEVFELVHRAEPLATTDLRAAGTCLGEGLATIVNVFNPDF